ncbi:hypothetical protein NQ314_010502 [Rhamnusium bicolor]|uniref:Cilia- and flagella-associated protein 57 n=1 Tax=Rhamnusium bicolor TaxID=1586634 RepID=A0AAV8XQH1_9CUCU|nr:hypothetical protein NQ314_010502 [Rhamnusium bicolor]
MNLPILQPKLFLGLETRIANNIHFLTDEEVVYPVGSVIAVHNFHVKKQRFIKLSDRGKHLTHLAISPNKKLIAVVETTDKLPIITLWCPTQFKKRRTLTLPTDKEIVANRYVSVDFTYDSKHIVCVTGEPDWTMYCFKCDKGRLESFARANNLNGTGTVNQVACNPTDGNQLALVGDSVMRCLGCQDFTWRLFGYNKVDTNVYTSVCWLSQDRLIVGSSTGKLLILETGELKAIFHASDLPVINMKARDEMEESSQTSIKSVASIPIMEGETESYEIRSIVNFNTGFAFGFMNGLVHLYERETPNKFIKRGIFIIPDRRIHKEYEEEQKIITGVNTIAINPAQDRLLVSCNEMQLWTSRLFVHDDNTGPEVTLRDFGYPIHTGPIGSLAVCRWKPIALTSGNAECLKVDEVELIQHFEDDIYSIALHPTGLYAVVGFSDKLRYMTIMIDDIITTKEFHIRSCRMVSFSKMGHLFAAANVNVIQVYSSITFEQMYIFKGHNGKIQGMSWSYEDNILATCGTDGAVYAWEVAKSTRVSEVIIKANPFTGVCVNREGKNMFAIGLDGHVREMFNYNIHRDVVLTDVPLDGMALSQLDTMLFVTGNHGVVYVVQLPLLEKAEYVEYIMHNTTITKMCLSCDDRFLITGAENGSLCFWKLLNIEDKSPKYDADVSTCNEILISRQILEEKIDQIRNLQLRMKELETEHSYQMRQSEALYSTKIQDIHSGYCNAIEELKIKNEQLDQDHVQEINNINIQINNMRAGHEEFVHRLEDSYNEKLIFEYNKFHRFETKMEKLLHEHEARYEELKKAKLESEEALKTDFMEQLNDKESSYEELMEHSQQQTKEHELIKQQIEDDADREIYELKENHEKELKEEQDLNVRLRGEGSVIKKKLLAAQKESDDLKHTVFCLENEHVKFKGIILNLEKDIMEIKKEMQERDQTIEEKEKRVYQLKSKNQELEKFKFILDFKIKELKSQIEPKERTIQEQVTQINEMVGELENLQKVILGLDLQLSELREKLAASNNEVKKEIEKNRRMKKALQDIRIDIHHASSFVQNVPMLQKTVKATNNTNMLSYDKVRLVDENSSLLIETNHLRKNLQAEMNTTKKLHALVGLSYISPKMAQRKVNMAAATNKEIHDKYKEKIAENEKAIDAMKEENNRLLNRITEMENEEG